MTEQDVARQAGGPLSGGSTANTAEFDALYRGETASFGHPGVSMSAIPWQLDGPQPLVRGLVDDGEITDPVLDAGCGLGDNALLLAERGYRVTGFDASPTAIERCRRKAAERGLDVEFLVEDATELTGLPSGVATVVDSALYHCLDRPQRRAYLEALQRICVPGARLHLLCFGPEASAVLPIPDGLDEASLRADLESGWRIEEFTSARYTAGLTRSDWQENIVPLVGEFPRDLQRPEAVDDQDRVLLPIWQIRATRR